MRRGSRTIPRTTGRARRDHVASDESLAMQRSQRPLFLADDRRCVVRFQRESQTDLNRVLDNRRQALFWK